MDVYLYGGKETAYKKMIEALRKGIGIDTPPDYREMSFLPIPVGTKRSSLGV